MDTRPNQSPFEELNLQRAVETASACISWAVETFGTEVCLLSSMQDSTLIDIATQVDPSIEVVFLDNGYHWKAFLDHHEPFRDNLRAHWSTKDGRRKICKKFATPDPPATLSSAK